MKRLLPFTLLFAAATAQAQDATLPNVAVPALDLQRYAGQWHEIAHVPMFFQRNCVANITATYTPRDDGRIGVRNACDDKQGKRMVSEGVARPVHGQPGQLEVRFAPDWLAWVPMVWADYWVVDLDPDYSLVAISEPKREYLWVLSRSPQVDTARYTALLARLEGQGFDTSKLVTTKQMD